MKAPARCPDCGRPAVIEIRRERWQHYRTAVARPVACNANVSVDCQGSGLDLSGDCWFRRLTDHPHPERACRACMDTLEHATP